jgi:methylase of polypeptide subunit release factors
VPALLNRPPKQRSQKAKKSSRVNAALAKYLSTDIWQESWPTTSSYTLIDTWKNEKRNWGHSLHSMASRSGSFPPALADYFIQRFSKPGDTVLDPFSGKGTTALQACLGGRLGIGVDVAPEAYALTAAKTICVEHNLAVKYLRQLKINNDPRKCAALLQEVPDNVKVFYHDSVLAQLVSLREELAKDFSIGYLSYDQAPYFEMRKPGTRAQYAQYWLGVLIGILHGSSELSLSVACSHSFSMAPGYVRKYSAEHGLEKPDRDVIECLIKRSEKLQSDGANTRPGRAILGSAMKLPASLTETVDLMVTSPPYFTAQTYAWDNWLREWFMGFDFKDVRKQTLHTAVVDKYSEGMYQHLAEAYRVLKPGAWAFVVVGDVIKKSITKLGKEKTKVEELIITANIIATEAERAGFKVEMIINDDIPPTSRYNSSFLKQDQGLKLDRIVCLRKH